MPSDQDRSALNDEERAKRYCAEIESSHGPDCPDCFEAMVGALSAEFAAVREESRAEVEKLTKERDEARAEAFRAMRIADAITLDTQSIEETVASLVDLTRKARAERDEFEAQLHDKETGVRRDRRLLQAEVEKLRAAQKFDDAALADAQRMRGEIVQLRAELAKAEEAIERAYVDSDDDEIMRILNPVRADRFRTNAGQRHLANREEKPR